MTDRAALIAEADKWMAERGPGWSSFGLIARLREALSSSPRAAGWKMVPVEPTEAMLAKIREHYAPHFPPDDPHGFRESWVTEAARHYRDMLAAAPSPPATAGERWTTADREAVCAALDIMTEPGEHTLGEIADAILAALTPRGVAKPNLELFQATPNIKQRIRGTGGFGSTGND